MSKRVSKTRRTKDKKPMSKKDSVSWQEWREGLSPEQKKVGKGMLILIGIIMAPGIIFNVWFSGREIFGQINARATIKESILDKNLLDMNFVTSYVNGGVDLIGAARPSITNIFKKPKGMTNQEIVDAIEKEVVASGWTEIERNDSFISGSVRLEAKKFDGYKRLRLEISVSDDVKIKVEK